MSKRFVQIIAVLLPLPENTKTEVLTTKRKNTTGKDAYRRMRPFNDCCREVSIDVILIVHMLREYGGLTALAKLATLLETRRREIGCVEHEASINEAGDCSAVDHQIMEVSGYISK